MADQWDRACLSIVDRLNGAFDMSSGETPHRVLLHLVLKWSNLVKSPRLARLWYGVRCSENGT